MFDFDTMLMAFATHENEKEKVIEKICNNRNDDTINVNDDDFTSEDLRNIRGEVYKRTGRIVNFSHLG